MTTHQVAPIPDSTHVASARGAVRTLAEHGGFADEDAYRAGLVTTELATNLAKHASEGGEILFRLSRQTDVPELELIALDRGPGIADPARALVDGHSTAGSAGTGLGAIRRLSEEFDIHSAPGRGTVVWARLRGGRAAASRHPAFEAAGVSVAIPGEFVSGDAWSVCHRAEGLSALVADGLGHGPAAAEAAVGAVRAFADRGHAASTTALEAIHDAIRHTRGAACGIAVVERDRGVVTFAGVGNIATTILQTGTARQAVSHAGILGHQVRRFREYSYPWDARALLVMHSDGVSSHWSLDDYPGLRLRRPAVVAAVLFRDYNRGRDDATVVVIREAA